MIASLAHGAFFSRSNRRPAHLRLLGPRPAPRLENAPANRRRRQLDSPRKTRPPTANDLAPPRPTLDRPPFDQRLHRRIPSAPPPAPPLPQPIYFLGLRHH